MSRSKIFNSVIKVFAGLIGFAVVFAGITPANAEQPVTIVIIDSGFDTSRINGNIVQEVCAIATSRCNNGKNLEVGPGASGTTVSINPKNLSDWEHGTSMANFVLEENPDANLILIRNSKLYGGTVLPGTESDLLAALSWVASNADEYNIVAVSMSRGSIRYASSNKEINALNSSIRNNTAILNDLKSKPRVNTKMVAIYEKRLQDDTNKLNSIGRIACPVTETLSSMVTTLQKDNIATILATGNDANKSYVDYPACIDDVVAVASASNDGTLNASSNISYNTDFAVIGKTTSEAAARLAGAWSLVYNGSYNSTYETIANSGTKSNFWSAIFLK